MTKNNTFYIRFFADGATNFIFCRNTSRLEESCSKRFDIHTEEPSDEEILHVKPNLGFDYSKVDVILKIETITDLDVQGQRAYPMFFNLADMSTSQEEWYRLPFFLAKDLVTINYLSIGADRGAGTDADMLISILSYIANRMDIGEMYSYDPKTMLPDCSRSVLHIENNGGPWTHHCPPRDSVFDKDTQTWKQITAAILKNGELQLSKNHYQMDLENAVIRMDQEEWDQFPKPTTRLAVWDFDNKIWHDPRDIRCLRRYVLVRLMQKVRDTGREIHTECDAPFGNYEMANHLGVLEHADAIVPVTLNFEPDSVSQLAKQISDYKKTLLAHLAVYTTQIYKFINTKATPQELDCISHFLRRIDQVGMTLNYALSASDSDSLHTNALKSDNAFLISGMEPRLIIDNHDRLFGEQDYLPRCGLEVSMLEILNKLIQAGDLVRVVFPDLDDEGSYVTRVVGMAHAGS